MAKQTRPKIVMQMDLRMGATERLRAVAEVIIDPKLEAIAGADILVPGPGKIDAALMDRAGPSLKLIAKPGIGVDNVDIPAATARQVLVLNTPDAPSESTAEHAVALLMAVAKRIVVGDMQLRTDCTIPREEMIGTELLGSSLGVIGYGRIGRRVAEICALGLRMNVLVYDPYIKKLNRHTPPRTPACPRFVPGCGRFQRVFEERRAMAKAVGQAPDPSRQTPGKSATASPIPVDPA